MPISFRAIGAISAILYATLFAALLLFPELIYLIFNIEGHETADFMSRRAAMLFLGLSVIAFLSRAEAHSSLRQTLCVGFFMFLSALAILGMFEFIRGAAGPGIWLAIIAELVLALAYLRIWKVNR